MRRKNRLNLACFDSLNTRKHTGNNFLKLPRIQNRSRHFNAFSKVPLSSRKSSKNKTLLDILRATPFQCEKYIANVHTRTYSVCALAIAIFFLQNHGNCMHILHAASQPPYLSIYTWNSMARKNLYYIFVPPNSRKLQNGKKGIGSRTFFCT